MANEWTRVTAVAAVPSTLPWPEHVIEGIAIVLVRDDDDRIRAVRSRCPHLGTPMTSALVTGSTIECSRHFYAYDLSAGTNTFPGDERDEPIEIFEVEVRDGDVWVRVPSASAGENP